MTQDVRRFGAYEVATLRDGLFEASLDVLIHLDGAAARERALAAFDAPTIRIDVNCFLLRGPDGVALIDAGCGEAWGAPFGHARAALRDMGVAPSDVRRVLLTHLHSDHAFGLYDGDAPYFPSAEILAPEKDLAYFTDPVAREALPPARRGAFAIAEQVRRVYGERLRGFAERAVLPGVEAIPAPGHTPGHTAYLIGDGASRLLIIGDTLHLAALQGADPRVGVTFDLDAEQAMRTRRSVLSDAAQNGWIVAGSHLAGLHRVRRGGDGFAFSPA